MRMILDWLDAQHHISIQMQTYEASHTGNNQPWRNHLTLFPCRSTRWTPFTLVYFRLLSSMVEPTLSSWTRTESAQHCQGYQYGCQMDCWRQRVHPFQRMGVKLWWDYSRWRSSHQGACLNEQNYLASTLWQNCLWSCFCFHSRTIEALWSAPTGHWQWCLHMPPYHVWQRC
jgi:hypothetical protein